MSGSIPYSAMQRARRKVKSRTGCARCKERRIKCDENVPCCLQCSKRSFTCPGYTKAVKWSTKHELKATDWQDPENPELFSSQPSSRQWFSDQVERFHAVLQSGLRLSPGDTSTQDETSQVVTSSSDPANSNGDSPRMTSEYAADYCLLSRIGQSPLGTVTEMRSPLWQRDIELSLPSLLTDDYTSLVVYYFTSVCRIISGFDSPTNPLRACIAALLPHSSVIHHCVLSISAAHLVQQRKAVRELALTHNSNALSCLATETAQMREQDLSCHGELPTQESSSVTVLLFGIIMLGVTSSWYDSASLGLEHLIGARALFRARISPTVAIPSYYNSSRTICSPDYRFLARTMAYWEAVGSFIADQDIDTADYLLPFCGLDGNGGSSVNPWSGVSAILFLYMSKVGSIARQLHHLRKLSAPLSQIVDEARQILLQKARYIEALVCRHKLPGTERLESTGDKFTPVGHFQTIARAYRLSILLELYRMFPEMTIQESSLSLSLFSEEAQRHVKCHGQLHGLAIDIMSLIASIPENSGTRAVQTLALIIAGSTLHYNSTEYVDNPQDKDFIELPFGTKEVILFWRSFATSRLHNLSQYVGLDTVRRAHMIVVETWEREEQRTWQSMKNSTNLSTSSVHWIDVMSDKRLETLLG